MQSKLKLELGDFEEWGRSAHESSTKTGWLMKQGKNNVLSFKRRFFVLDGSMLFYYDGEDPDSMIGAILVEGAEVHMLDDKQFSQANCDYVFKIVTRSGRTINLGAETASDRSDWIVAIEESMQSSVHTDLAKAENEILKLRAELQKVCIDRTKLRQALSSTQQASKHLNQACELMNSACPPTPGGTTARTAGAMPVTKWNRQTISGVQPRLLTYDTNAGAAVPKTSYGNLHEAGDSFTAERSTLPARSLYDTNGR